MALSRTFILHQDHHTEAVIAFIRSNAPVMALTGTPLSVTVAEHKAKRSLEQNARLHALLQDVAANAWVAGKQHDYRVWKRYFKEKFIGTEEIVLPDGRVVEEPISTTTLDVAAFSDFMTKIEEYAQTVLAVELAQ